MNKSDPNQTVLKVGELASRAGLTVRALHHYDRIGLLKPSARAASGYRLYDRADIARLHQIQALRRFDLPLAQIAAILARPDTSFSEILAQQIAALGRQIEQASLLRERLSQLQSQLHQGAEPDLAGWLSTLEMMTAFDKYFTPEELKRLPFFPPDAQRDQAWSAMVAEIQALMNAGTPVDSPQAQQLALRWMRRLEHDTAADPDFALRMSAMVELEPAARQHTGITPALKQYVIDALAEFKLAIYARYLDAGELCHMREQGGKYSKEWLLLIAQVHRQMQAGTSSRSAEAQALARQWFTLFRLGAGDNPATQIKIRTALEQEPQLLAGSWISAGMLDFIRQAAAAGEAGPCETSRRATASRT